MAVSLEIPERPGPPPAPQPVVPPMVYVAPTWEYKHLTRKLGKKAPLSERELEALGTEGWELTGVISVAGWAHFYFKRSAT